jgi:hypothetical protein
MSKTLLVGFVMSVANVELIFAEWCRSRVSSRTRLLGDPCSYGEADRDSSIKDR